MYFSLICPSFALFRGTDRFSFIWSLGDFGVVLYFKEKGKLIGPSGLDVDGGKRDDEGSARMEDKIRRGEGGGGRGEG